MKTELKGVLEIDHDRGVIYFHVDDAEKVKELGTVSPLRICQLPIPIPDVRCSMLDITHMVGTSWRLSRPRTWTPG